MSFSIPIGWRGSHYLTLKIDIKGNSIKLSVPLPDGYPQTEVGITLKDRGLFSAHLSYGTKYWHHDKVIERFSRQYGIDLRQPSLYLTKFKVLSRLDDIPETEEEKQMLRGLGRRCLCLAVPIIVDYLRIDKQNIISLHASPSGKWTAEDKQRLQQLSLLDKDTLVEQYLEKEGFPSSMLDDPSTEEDCPRQRYLEEREYLYTRSNEDLARDIIQFDNTEELVRYYQTYQFIRKSDYGDIVMTTSVERFLLHNC